MNGMKLIVCGGRDYADWRSVWLVLSAVKSNSGIAKIVQGGCRTGADEHARAWAENHNIPCESFNADWQRYGKAAGPMRNQQMADAGADGCVAFPGGRGTADMIRRAVDAGIKTWEPARFPKEVAAPEGEGVRGWQTAES